MTKVYLVEDITKTGRIAGRMFAVIDSISGWIFDYRLATRFEYESEAAQYIELLKKYGQPTTYSKIKKKQVPRQFAVVEMPNH